MPNALIPSSRQLGTASLTAARSLQRALRPPTFRRPITRRRPDLRQRPIVRPARQRIPLRNFDVQFVGDQVLFAGDQVAMDPACCCPAPCPNCGEDTIRNSYTLTITGTSIPQGCLSISPFALDNLWVTGDADFDGTYTLLPQPGFTCCFYTFFNGPVIANVTCDGGGPIAGATGYPVVDTFLIQVCKNSLTTWSLWIYGLDGTGALSIQLWGISSDADGISNGPQDADGTLCDDEDDLPVWSNVQVDEWVRSGAYTIGTTGTAVLS